MPIRPKDWRRHALFMARSSKVPSRTERARVALACVWMQLLKPRKTATSQGCYDVWKSGLHSGQGGLAGRGCWPCPREGSTLVLLCLGSSRRPMWPRAAGSWSCWPSRSLTSRDECAPARAAPARRRLSCQRARSAPACAAGHSPC